MDTVPRFNIGDRVMVAVLGEECTSTSLEVGDIGTVKRLEYFQEGWSSNKIQSKMQVLFTTKNGPRMQWIHDTHLAPYTSPSEDPLLKRLQERVALTLDRWKSIEKQYDASSKEYETAVERLNQYNSLVEWLDK